MPLVTVRHTIVRRIFTAGERAGEGYQVLYKCWYLGPVRIWSKELDREPVPVWAFIQQCTLGRTHWVSRLYEEYGHLLED